MDGILKAVREKIEIEKQLQHQLERCSADICAAMFEEFAPFPHNSNGQLCWPAHWDADVGDLRKHLLRFFEYDDCFSGCRAQRMWPLYLEAAFPFMRGMPLIDMLTSLVVRTWHHRSCGKAWLQSVEFFCGKANLSLAALEAGLKAAAMDKTLNPEHNVLEAPGLRLALLLLTATVPGALGWLGSPCNSYVVLCRAQSLRSADNMYLGDESKYFVLEGNCLGDISALLVLLGVMTLLRFGLEQPQNSVLPYSGCMAAVLRYVEAEQTLTYHYCFGGETLKPLQLWSCDPFICALGRPKPSCCYHVGEESGLVSRDNEGGFTGHKERLKESQAYSKEFGRAIVRAFLSHQQQ